MIDKLKSHEIVVCPVKLSFLFCKSQFERTRKWCVFQEKAWINNDIFFPVDDFILH